MSHLSLPDLLTLQALRRAGRGVLTRHEGRFFDDGHLVGVLRSDVLDALLEQRLLELSAPDEDGTARVAVTEAGQARRTALDRPQRRRGGLPVPPEQHRTTTIQAPAGHRLSDPRLPAPGDRPVLSSRGALPAQISLARGQEADW